MVEFLETYFRIAQDSYVVDIYDGLLEWSVWFVRWWLLVYWIMTQQ